MEQVMPYLLAFFGGIFGAVFGGATVFIIFGFFGLVGIALVVSTGSDVFLNTIALSPIFSPEISFAGAVAAAAYWGKVTRDKAASDSGVEIFDGSNIFAPLVSTNNVNVLLVGGVFGVLGYTITSLLNGAGFPADNIAVGVVVTNILARLLFGGSLTSQLPIEVNKIELFTKPIVFNIIWSFALAVVIGGIVDVIQIPLFGFVLGAFVLIFIAAGVNIPMIHHVALIAGIAMLTFGNIWMAGVFGVIASLLCDFIGIHLNAKVQSHIDPPAAAIIILSLVLAFI